MEDTTSAETGRVDHVELESFVRDVLLAAGAAAVHADRVAEALVRADLREVKTHGLARLEAYIDSFEAGGFNPDASVTVEPVADAAVLVDADGGPGQSAGIRAMDAAMERAGEYGVGIAGVTNSNHFGAVAYYTERASDAGYVGLGMTNADSDVVPYGGTEPFLGTNPVSFSIPTDRSYPITLDMATSVVANGKINHAAEEGESLPEHWAVDEDGDPATTPEAVAALRPVGGPKGYGLGLVVDILCGLLTGAGPSTSAGSLYEDYGKSMDIGHFIAAIDVDAFIDEEIFREIVGNYIDQLKAQETRQDVDEIRVPGELEARAMKANVEEGVVLSDGGRKGILRLADRYNLTPPDPL